MASQSNGSGPTPTKSHHRSTIPDGHTVGGDFRFTFPGDLSMKQRLTSPPEYQPDGICARGHSIRPCHAPESMGQDWRYLCSGAQHPTVVLLRAQGTGIQPDGLCTRRYSVRPCHAPESTGQGSRYLCSGAQRPKVVLLRATVLDSRRRAPGSTRHWTVDVVLLGAHGAGLSVPVLGSTASDSGASMKQRLGFRRGMCRGHNQVVW